jgi:hypothetical protein
MSVRRHQKHQLLSVYQRGDFSSVRATLQSAQILCNTCKGKPKLIIYENIENIHTPCKGKPKRKI